MTNLFFSVLYAELFLGSEQLPDKQQRLQGTSAPAKKLSCTSPLCNAELWVLEVLVGVFFCFGQNHASCSPLFPVFLLSYANWLQTVAIYLTDTYESGMNILI